MYTNRYVCTFPHTISIADDQRQMAPHAQGPVKGSRQVQDLSPLRAIGARISWRKSNKTGIEVHRTISHLQKRTSHFRLVFLAT